MATIKTDNGLTLPTWPGTGTSGGILLDHGYLSDYTELININGKIITSVTTSQITQPMEQEKAIQLIEHLLGRHLTPEERADPSKDFSSEIIGKKIYYIGSATCSDIGESSRCSGGLYRLTKWEKPQINDALNVTRSTEALKFCVIKTFHGELSINNIINFDVKIDAQFMYSFGEWWNRHDGDYDPLEVMSDAVLRDELRSIEGANVMDNGYAWPSERCREVARRRMGHFAFQNINIAHLIDTGLTFDKKMYYETDEMLPTTDTAPKPTLTHPYASDEAREKLLKEIIMPRLKDKPKSTKKKTKAKALTIDVLKKVILPRQIKEEIVSVINQSEQSTKLFEEWGLAETIEYGKGQTMLFWGKPGTGKTMCARAIADGLGKPLMAISSAELQTSEPGGMERAVKKAFAEAKQKKAVLLLDECDSLVYSRENMGMILSAEINCLLTEIEKYEGILVLSTNRVNKLDKALERRISLIVEFPVPDKAARHDIWKAMIPKKLPLARDVKLDELSDLEFTGGQIKNVLLGAARLAAGKNKKRVDMMDFIAAASRAVEGTNAFNRKTSSLDDRRERYNADSRGAADDLGESMQVQRDVRRTIVHPDEKLTN